MKKHLIVSAQLTSTSLMLVTSEAKILNVMQGRQDLPKLVELCKAHLVPGGKELWLSEEEISGETLEELRANIAGPLAQIEQKSGGLIKFFRMARKTAARLFGMSDQTDGTFIRLDDDNLTATSVPIHDEDGSSIPEAAIQTMRIQEVMEQAKPITQKEINKGIAVSHETVVAVTDKGAMIGIEALEASLAQGELEGPTKLIERMANTKLEHTAQDVLSFLKRGDLPLTKDGNIIAYKRLAHQISNGISGYTDVHSRTVFQCVGDVVQMDATRVDRNRRKDCSVGLHIARRGYLRSFNGAHTVVVLIRPEDVIAVPHNTPDKVRVAKYQIIFELSPEGTRRVNNDIPLDPDKDQNDLKMINALIGGWIPEPSGIVTVSGPTENDVVRTEVVGATKSEISLPDMVEVAKPLDTSKVIDAAGAKKAKPTNSGHVIVAAALIELPRKAEAKRLYDLWDKSKKDFDLQNLLDFKKKSKVSWGVLGIPNPVQTVIEPVQLVESGTDTKPLSYKERIAQLRPFNSKNKVTEAIKLKKASKKGWTTLGVTEDELKLIESWEK